MVQNIKENSLTELSEVEKEILSTVGLNWCLNRNLRLMLDFERTEFERGNVSA